MRMPNHLFILHLENSIKLSNSPLVTQFDKGKTITVANESQLYPYIRDK